MKEAGGNEVGVEIRRAAVVVLREEEKITKGVTEELLTNLQIIRGVVMIEIGIIIEVQT